MLSVLYNIYVTSYVLTSYSITINAIIADIPVPLATKIYYSQRNTRLRLAVARMYHAASAKGINSNVVSPEVSQETIIQLPASSCKGCTHEQVGGLNKKV